MNKSKFALFLLPVIFLACSKSFIENDLEKYQKENIAEIKAHLVSNNLNDFSEDANTGIFWKLIQENPEGEEANGLNRVHVEWKLSTLGGLELSSIAAEDSLFYEYNYPVFDGFIIALNTLKEGEKGVFYIPSIYAFRDTPPSNLTGLGKWEPVRLELEVIKMYSEIELMDWFIARNNLREPEITDIGVRVIRTTDDRPETKDIESGDDINLKYKGYFISKEKNVFDEGSFDYVVGSGGLIAGFENALTKMRVGEKVTILIPSEHAYGSQGSSAIPPNTPIAFDLEIEGLN
jgi:FKBP-type peptidyl-prolyl cis-trans isomerase